VLEAITCCPFLAASVQTYSNHIQRNDVLQRFAVITSLMQQLLGHTAVPTCTICVGHCWFMTPDVSCACGVVPLQLALFWP